jgi:hypothetical protein
MPAGPSSLGNRPSAGGPVVKPRSATADAGVPPVIRPGGGATPGPDRPGLIAIGGAPMTAIKVGVHVDPFTFWMNYYKLHDESPGELHETVRLLGVNRRMRDVEAALRGYLWNRGNNAEAWMYRALAMAMQMNQGSQSDVKVALGYAADLAQKSHNPNDLVSVADTMVLLGQLDRVGALLDEAATKIPHRNEPLKMSVNLAQRVKDPVRMGVAIEKLLSLGWAGEDEYIRSECRRQVDLLGNALREDGRTNEAAGLVDQLTRSLARDVYVRLSWDGYADFDLAVDEPLGVTASYDLPRTVFGGSIIKNGFGSHPEEVYVCPRGFDGDYTVHIRKIWADDKQPVVQLKLETIVHEGTAQEHKEVHVIRPETLDQTFVLRLSGGRRKTVLPYIDPLAGRLEYQAKGRPASKSNSKSRAARAANPERNPKARAAAKAEAKPKS